MGDILHALPAVTALREAHPNWTIDWVVEPRWRALLAAETASPASNPGNANPDHRGPARPVVDRLHFAATRDWRKRPVSSETLHAVRALRRDLKACQYDVVLDLQGAIRSSVIAKMTGCPRVIGEDAPRERAARWLYHERVRTRGAHVIEQDVELATAIAGDELATIPPPLPVDSAAESWADTILPSGNRTPVVLINPGAGWGAKRWPIERYAAVAAKLTSRGLRVLVNVGPGEEPLAASIIEETQGAAMPLTCSLDQLIAVTRRIHLAIAGDTGPLHLACALQKPVVGIFGPTDPSRNGPYGCRFNVLRSPQSVRDHTRHEAPEAGLLTISPEAVLEAAGKLLAGEAA
jgi:heptosyltransferase I